MCGILCSVSESGACFNNICEKCSSILKSRGPDYCGYFETTSDCTKRLLLHFAGSVLWTQGSEICKQPFTDDCGIILLWNGDIFGGIEAGDKSDTEVLAEKFCSGNIVHVLCELKGPYSFIYYSKSSKCIWFGRDPLGRTSLLWLKEETTLVLSSVSTSSVAMNELPPIGIFKLNLDNFDLSLNPWSHQRVSDYLLPDELKIESIIEYTCISTIFKSIVDLECSQSIENIYLEEYDKNNGDINSMFNKLISLDHHSTSSILCNLFEDLDNSVRIRCQVRPQFCKDCKHDKKHGCKHPKLGILFSGGLDSTILALFADKHIPPDEPIDLYNVAFEKPSPLGPFNAPDRVTGLSSLKELKTLCPNRIWNFVQIDVTRKKLDSFRDTRIADLIYPLESILDDSLGCALWFAASGKGTVNELPYDSPATIALLGMGADEMFGGYRKAKRAFKDSGWDGLAKELVNGLLNLPVRNLGRDSRIVYDHSRVPRFPFLDETVVSNAYSLPAWIKCYLGPELPEGVGDKILLRLLAWKLGLRSVSLFPKRALQFGSRIANSKEAGHDVSFKLHKSWSLNQT